MSSVTRNTRVAIGTVLLSAAVSSGSYSATMDDELTIDPTRPLSGYLDESATVDGSDESGGLFELFGAFNSYELSSVLIRSGDRIAVINNEQVRVGDEIGAAVVASIESDHVTLNIDGDITTVPLFEGSIKTLVKGEE